MIELVIHIKISLVVAKKRITFNGESYQDTSMVRRVWGIISCGDAEFFQDSLGHLCVWAFGCLSIHLLLYIYREIELWLHWSSVIEHLEGR